MKWLGRLSDAAYLLLRIVAGLLFAQHGVQKLFGLLGGNAVPPLSLLGAAGVIELVGGALIALGAWTGPLAFLASGEMAVAYFRNHAGQGLFPVQNRGELAALYCFLFLYIACKGGGKWRLTRG
jgi:putative oxidoreductase